MLGRLPWFALLRRRRALRFLVFFDIGFDPIGATPPPQREPDVLCRAVSFEGQFAETQASSWSRGQVFSTRSSGTPVSAARSQP